MLWKFMFIYFYNFLLTRHLYGDYLTVNCTVLKLWPANVLYCTNTVWTFEKSRRQSLFHVQYCLYLTYSKYRVHRECIHVQYCFVLYLLAADVHSIQYDCCCTQYRYIFYTQVICWVRTGCLPTKLCFNFPLRNLCYFFLKWNWFRCRLLGLIVNWTIKIQRRFEKQHTSFQYFAFLG